MNEKLSKKTIAHCLTAIICILFFIPLSGFTQNVDVDIRNNWDKKHDNYSTSLSAGRWEIIMSDRTVKLLFKIDKFTGQVFYDKNIKFTDGGTIWLEAFRDESAFDIRKDNTINYQLYIGGLAARHVYLLNIHTGVLWQLVETEEKLFYFQRI